MRQIMFGISLGLALVGVGLVASASCDRCDARLDCASGRVRVGLEGGGVIVGGHNWWSCRVESWLSVGKTVCL